MVQKELKAVYAEELKKAWHDDKMVAYCSKSVAVIIEHNGELFGIEKPKIETRFCFGYGMNGITDAEQEASAESMVKVARESKDYFINQNLLSINRWIVSLKDILDDMSRNWAEGSYPRHMIETGKQYYGQTDDCRLRYYSIVDMFGGANRGEICNDTELIEKLLDGYEVVKTEFVKRLNTYLKRYGMSKVKTWSYLVD